MAKKPFSLSDLAARVAALAPTELAEDWDNVGLQVGDPARAVRRVMTCLEVSAPTLAEARRRRADAIVAHHPLIFAPLESLDESEPAERLVAGLVRAGVGLVAAHTNLDSAEWGTNEVLAEACGLKPIGPLEPREGPAPLKLVVFTPKGHERALIEAIARGGGGRIGAYTHCTFRGPGTGSFRGGEGTDPFIGRSGRLEEAEEYRLEAMVWPEARASVLAEVLAAHPYEEPAYEFYVLAAGGKAGPGAIARPAEPLSAEALARRIKRRLKIPRVRLAGPMKRRVTKIAICTGSGGSLLARAARSGAEAFVTGEMNYHHGMEAHARGICTIEIGHFESERIVAGPLAKRLGEDPAIKAARIAVFPAARDLQPFRWL